MYIFISYFPLVDNEYYELNNKYWIKNNTVHGYSESCIS